MSHQVNHIDKLLYFLWKLKRGDRPSAKDLMIRFDLKLGAAQKTIRRMRERYHLPIRLVRRDDRYGYEIIPGESFELPAVWIEEENLFMLAASVQALQYADKGARHLIDEYFKSTCLLTHKAIQQLEQRLACKATGSYTCPPGILSPIIRAILENRPCTMAYKPVYQPLTPFEAKIWPLYLIHYRGNWYVVAEYEGHLRTYALARITSVAVIEEEQRTMDEALQEKLERIRQIVKTPFGIHTTDDDGTLEQIRLRFQADIVPYIETVIFHEEQVLEEAAPDGSRVLTFPSYVTRELLSEILHYGPWVEVLEPAGLRAQVAQALEKALSRYR